MHRSNHRRAKEGAAYALMPPPLLLPRPVETLIGRLCWSSGGGNPVGDSETHSDLRQEALVLLWGLRERLDALPPEEAGAFAYRCVRHLLLRSLTRETKRCRPLLRGEAARREIDSAVATAEVSAAADATAGESLLHLLERFVVLSAKERIVLDLYYGQELSDREVAERLGEAQATVKMRRLRALVRLRKHLLPERL